MHEHGVTLDQFEGILDQRPRQRRDQPFAMYRNKLRPGAFSKAPVVADPSTCSTRAGRRRRGGDYPHDRRARAGQRPAPVLVRGSAAATDTLALHNRRDLLFLQAANLAAGRA